jgi:CHAT domain-containing protein
MQAKLTNFWGKTCLFLFFALVGGQLALAQDALIPKEITEALENAKSGNYEQAIPVLKKYADDTGFDDLTTLQIRVYLNLGYLATENEALNVDATNELTDNYILKYGITKTYQLKGIDEIYSIYWAAQICFNVKKFEKAIAFLSLLKEIFEENDVQNQFYLKILDLLYLVYKEINETEKSIAYLKKEVEIGKGFWGEGSPDYLLCLDNLALFYSSIGDYKNALVFDLDIVRIRKEVLGDKHQDYLASLTSVLVCYMMLEDYQKALEINLYLVDAQKTELGENDPQYLTSLNNLSIVYSELRNFNKALEFSQKVNELCQRIYGEKTQDYFKSLQGVALAYLKIGDYGKSLEIMLQVVELGKEVLGERHKDYLNSLGNLAEVYSKLGDYKKAFDIYLFLVNTQRTILGEKDSEYLTSLGNLAYQYSHLGNIPKAIELDLKVAELKKQILGEKHPDYLTSLNNISVDYSELGEYQKALEINQKVTELRKDTLGEMHPDYFTSLANSAVIYGQMGQDLKSLEILLYVVKLEKEILGENNPLYLTSLNNLALQYSDLGNYQKSLEVNQKVVEIRKHTLGENHPDYLMSLNNLASSYSHLGNYQKSLEINQTIADLLKNVLSEKHPYYLTALNNLAYDNSKLGNYQKSLELNQKVAEIRKETLGENHPDYITSLANIALDYTNMKNYKKALEIFVKVEKLSAEKFQKNHPLYFYSLGNLAGAEYDLAKYDDASFHFKEMIHFMKNKLVDYFVLMTENQREQFWQKYINSFSLFPMFLEKTTNTNPESAVYAYNIALFTKGLLLNTSIDFNQLIAEKGSPEAKAKFEELKLLRLQIQRLQEKPIAERHLNVDSLETVAQQKETELVKISKEYGDYTRNLKINWKDVQTNLQDKDVAIEFVEYPTLTDTIKYAALLLRKGWQYPQMIPLFRKDQIDEFIRQDKNKIYSNKIVGKQIRQLVWEPLEKVVSPGERVYFSPAGIYHQLAIENLAASDSTTLGDIYQMYRLSSTKELVTQTSKSKYKTAVLYGGLQFDLDSVRMVAESKKYPKIEKLLAFRGYSNDTTVRKGWEYLGGTLQEVEQINRLMNDRQYLVTEYTGESGNEESFKSLSGKSPEIIHIATHGFFQPVEESRKNPFIQMRMGDQPESGGWVDPMLRSGLMLSGGNKSWQGEKIPENIEDGVLTAREISRMDLRSTDLVVLSACETGLGEVSSEGVFGLQRSFKQAGVKNLIMSLWEVSDQATSFMMKEFYTNLLSGEDLRKAFVDAKQKCKEKYLDPQYWAAFVLLN